MLVDFATYKHILKVTICFLQNVLIIPLQKGLLGNRPSSVKSNEERGYGIFQSSFVKTVVLRTRGFDFFQIPWKIPSLN